jgi:hypothetical protein
MDTLRRRNHFVPASYLAAFAHGSKKDGPLWAYRRSNPRAPLRTRPKAAAIEKDLYVRPTQKSTRDDEVERFFATEIERPFVAIRNRLVYGSAVGLQTSLGSLHPDERTVVARFIAFQALRGPGDRDAMRWLGSLSKRLHVREQVADGGEFRRHIEEINGERLNATKVAALREWLENLSVLNANVSDWLPRTIRVAERFVPIVLHHEWKLVHSPETVEQVTCDAPVVSVRRKGAGDAFELGGGWQEPGFEATLTLSHAIFFSLPAR